MIDFLSINDEIARPGDGDQSHQGDHGKYGRIFDISWCDSHSHYQERELADLSQRYSGEKIILSRMTKKS